MLKLAAIALNLCLVAGGLLIMSGGGLCGIVVGALIGIGAGLLNLVIIFNGGLSDGAAKFSVYGNGAALFVGLINLILVVVGGHLFGNDATLRTAAVLELLASLAFLSAGVVTAIYVTKEFGFDR
ncbi:MAG: hypothetical protein AAGI68_17145 [Planctomycetota bacterium]